MFRGLFVLFHLCLVPVLLAAETQTNLPHAEVEGDPSGVVAGCVNAITGTYSESEVDIAIAGSEPLSLQRFYCSADWTDGMLCHGWTYNHARTACLTREGPYYLIKASEATGGAVSYIGLWGSVRKGRTTQKKDYYATPDRGMHADQRLSEWQKGLTNTGTGEISGRTNLKNQIAYYHPHKRVSEEKLLVHLCHGGERTFKRFDQPQWGGYSDELPIYFQLTEERRTNGSLVTYEYLRQQKQVGRWDLINIRMSKIQLFNSSGNRLLGSLTFDHSEHNPPNEKVTVRANDGREVTYKFCNSASNRTYLSEVVRPNAPPLTYAYLPYEQDKSTEKVCSRSLPEGRFQQIEYYLPGDNWVGDQKVRVEAVNKPDIRRDRVRLLKAPVGSDDSPVLTHRFFYQNGFTDVRDASNHKTLYHYGDDQRLQRIEHYLGNSDATYTKYFSDKLFWGKEAHHQHTNLLNRALCEADGTVRSCRYLQYDGQHNVVAEHILGNLSGNNTIAPQLNGEGHPLENGCERYTVNRTYLDTPLRLLQSELLPNGRKTTLKYWQQTDLPEAKCVGDGQRILSREFHDYDENRVLIKTFIDDGSGQTVNDHTDVSVRKITYFVQDPKAPCIGLPMRIDEHYYDTNTKTEHSLGFVTNSYTREGWIKECAHHDAEGELRYVLQWDYDSMGNPIFERNALGQIIQRRFDANGNKIYEQGPSQDFHLEFTYDCSNRLITQEHVCNHGLRLKQSYTYDHLGNCIASVDIYGNKTRYEYDELNRLICTTLPPCADAEGHTIELQIRREYDIAGNVIAETDVQGNITRKNYNIRSQPTLIEYPDGTAERFEYNLDGSLRKQIGKNGSYTQLHYDVLGNITSKETYSPAGELLSGSSATYRGSLMLSEIDPNGNVTHYSYDAAGRPLRISKTTGWTQYAYDSLGNKAKTIQWVGPSEDDVRVTIEQHDLLGRVIEQRIEDKQGTIFSRIQTQYDPAGHVCAVITHTASGAAMTQTLYNALGQPWKVIDAEGHETLTHYDYSHINRFGERVLQMTVVDPLGNQTITTQDPLGRTANVIRKDSFGQETARTTQTHDSAGRLIKRIDHVKTADNPDRQVITEWQYDAMGRLIALHEGSGTAQLRQTFFNYNAFGQKDRDIFGDGLMLSYTYDPLGRLAYHAASDHSVAYRYTYDPLGNILSVTDEMSGVITSRNYDTDSRIIQETLGNGLSSTYEYDPLGRLISLHLPDGSGVRYVHDSNHLREISRVDTSGNIRYTHHYLTYDQSGNVLTAQFVGSAGTATYTWDQLQRLRRMHTPHVEEEIPATGYDAAGNLLERRLRNPEGEIHNQYTFDPLYQLISEEGLSKHQYQYDSLNNRIVKDRFACDIDPLNQLLRQGDKEYQYDARGNRIAETGNKLDATYAYDALNRLVEVNVEGRRWRYQYDPFNRRLSKTCYDANGNISDQEHYLYCDQMDIGAINKDGVMHQFRVLGKGFGAEIGSAVAIELGSNLYVPVHDHSGHVVALLSHATGEVVQNYSYTAFGEEPRHRQVWLWGLHGTDPSSANPWRFASKRHDPETGWILFGRRYYDAETARWTTRDPRGYDDGPNLYAYVHNSPLTHIDFYGLEAARCSRCGKPLERQARPRWKPYVDRSSRRQRQSNAPKMRHCSWFEKFQSWYPSSHNYDLGCPEPEGGGIGFTNGIKNNGPESKGHSKHVHDLAGGVNVRGTCNETHGIVVDLIECVMGLWGVTTDPVKRLHEKWDRALADGGTFLEVCTSQGTIHVRNALLTYSEEKRQQILVLAIAPAAYIVPGTCRQVYHYRNKNPFRDPIPYIDRKGARIARGTIREVDSHPDAPWFDHTVQSPTWDDITGPHLKIYRESEGERI